jgi:NADH:ubiquinone oxidoreductase subunit 5 (subunit L)/multisubunit Na+/H+ antiporter MnhA subunit
MLIITLLGPIASALSSLYLSRYIGSSLLKVTLLLYLMSSVSSVLLLYYTVVNGTTLVFNFTNWSTVLGINIEFTADILTSSLLAVITVVGSCVICYSCYYMATDSHLYRFIGLLSSFVSFMSILALSSNLVVLFVG